MQSSPAFLTESHKKAWLLHVAANLSKNKIDYNKIRETDELEETLVAEEREDLSFVWEAVKALPEKYREVLHLYYQEGYPTKEISKILNRNESSIRSDLKRGREALGGTMMKNAFYPSSTDPNPELAGSVYGMEECKSLAELTKKAGFNVKDISEADMPFKVMSTSYLWCWNEFAQIIYEGTDNSLTYRKTSGTDDILPFC